MRLNCAAKTVIFRRIVVRRLTPRRPKGDFIMAGLAVIGCGRIGKMHAGNIVRNPTTRLVGVFDVDSAAASCFANENNVRAYGSFEDVTQDPEVEGVIVASATGTHADYIEAAVASGTAVLCEKPIDLNLDRVNRCRDAIKGTEVPIQLGFNRRFDPGHAAVRETAISGEIGDIHQVIISSRDPDLPPREYFDHAGDIMRDMTIHDFDLARFMLDDEPTEVFAFAGQLVDPALMAEVGDYDTAMLLLRTADGKQCNINNSRRAVYGYDQRVEIHGSSGMAVSGNRRPHEARRHSASASGIAAPNLHFFIERYQEAFMAEISHFAHCIKTGNRPSPGFDDGRAALVLAEAANLSIRERRLVRVDEIS